MKSPDNLPRPVDEPEENLHMIEGMNLSHRLAWTTDLPVLARMNHELIQDEGHSNPMTIAELEERMREWLENKSHQIVVFLLREEIAGYATFRAEGREVYLRQLFVSRHLRGRGIGSQVMTTLQQAYFDSFDALRLDVLSHNRRAHEFYLRTGFSDYCVTMKKPIRRP